MELLSLLWNEILIRPMSNSLIVLYMVLFNNFGLSIISFTIIINAVLFPVTLRSIKQTQAMSSIQPKMEEMRKRYGNDRQRLNQEMMNLYREHGVNPIGCLGPMAVQFPILIGLYWAIIRTLPVSPERLADLSGLLYSWIPSASTVLPLQSKFLGIDLAQVGGAQGIPGYVIAVFVAISMWASMRMTSPGSGTGSQQQMMQMMQWMMPVFIGMLSLSLPVGLAVYWVASNVIRIPIQFAVTGQFRLSPAAAGASPRPSVAPPVQQETGDHEPPVRSERQERRRGHRTRSQAARRRARRGRNRGSQQR